MELCGKLISSLCSARNGYIFKGDNFPKIDLDPSEKGSTLKRKNLFPKGGTFIPFRVVL